MQRQDGVQRTIMNRLYRGQILRTPGIGYPPHGQRDFQVTVVSSTGVKIDKLGQEVRFDALEQAVSNIRNAGGDVLIGGKQGWADDGTLERFLQDIRGNNTRTSTYAAPLLVECGIAQYVRAPGPKRIRLTPSFMEQTS